MRNAAAVALLGLIITATATSAVPQGASKEDAVEVRKLGVELEGVVLEARPPSVDLRPLVPPIGRQTMNDCAAWAFGYYARSYLEARNQDWTPGEDFRRFSPSFIYNQVNGGRDKGSNPIKVLELLRDRGAATLSTFPYAAHDFRKQPPRAANTEAPTFRIDDFGVVENGEQMRSLLARGEMVVIGVRTNPVFSGGRYRIYDEASHARGRALRTAGQPHGYHAMAVAGYDDTRRAFLVLNSWGDDWGEDGAVWVDYDVADTFNMSESTEHLIDYGLVMFDSRSVVERARGIWREVDFGELFLDLRSRLSGYDADGGHVFYHYFVVAGGHTAERSLRSARWELWVDDEVVDSGSAAPRIGNRHSAFYRGPQREGTIRVHYETEDGQRGSVEDAFSFELANLRSARLRRRDAYHGARLNDGTHAWRWTVSPKLSAQDWADLAEIVWYAEDEDGTAQRVRKYTHDGSTAPSEDRNSGASYTAITTAPRGGYATLRFRDNTSLKVEFGADAFTSPVLSGPTVVVERRDVGQYHGQAWSHFDAKVLYPECWAEFEPSAEFEVVGLRLDGGLSFFEGEATRWPAPAGLAISGYACEDLAVRADLRLNLEIVASDYVDINQMFNARDGRWDSWVERSAESVLLDVVAEDPLVLWSDRYVGEVDGVPTWEVTQYLTNREDHSYGTPTYTWPDHVTHVRAQRSENVFCAQGEVLRTTGPYEVKVRREDYEVEGEPEVEHRGGVSPRSPRTNAVSLDVRRGIADAFSPVPEKAPIDMVEVTVLGPLDRLDRVLGFAVLTPSIGGGFQQARGRRHDLLPTDRDDLLVARVPEPAAGQPVRARIDYVDGASQLLDAAPRGFTPYPISDDLVLDVIERPWAIEDGLPLWVVNVRLTGPHQRLLEVERVEFASVDEAGKRRPFELVGDGWASEVLTSVPLRIEATVAFSKRSGLPPQAITGYATLETRHTEAPLEAFAILTDVDEVEIDPNAWDVTAGASEPVATAVAALRGWERDLRQIESVRYQIVDVEAREFVDDYDPEIVDVEQRDAVAVGAFGTPFRFVSPRFEFAPRVRRRGCDELESVPEIATTDRTFFRGQDGARSRVALFGAGEDGQPTWVLRLDNDHLATHRVANHVLYHVGGAPIYPLSLLESPRSPWPHSPANGAGFFAIATQIHPGHPAEALVSNVPTRGWAQRSAYESYRWREAPTLAESSIEFDEARMAQRPDDPGPTELQIVVEPFPGADRDALSRVRLVGPLRATVDAVRARYTIGRGSEEVTVEPFAIEGFGHDRFAIRVANGAPECVRCELMDGESRVITELKWSR